MNLIGMQVQNLIILLKVHQENQFVLLVRENIIVNGIS